MWNNCAGMIRKASIHQPMYLYNTTQNKGQSTLVISGIAVNWGFDLHKSLLPVGDRGPSVIQCYLRPHDLPTCHAYRQTYRWRVHATVTSVAIGGIVFCNVVYKDR